ncbi:hypothetical protein GGR58DRAFT_483461 [Xylaria digitata]|nr:hypothetical protein GGR58DRAFT_483461 [Xylaria digitata]
MAISFIAFFIQPFQPFLPHEEIDVAYYLPMAATILIVAAGSDIATHLEEKDALVMVITGYVVLGIATILLLIAFIWDFCILGWLFILGRPAAMTTKYVINACVLVTASAGWGVALQQLGVRALLIFPLEDGTIGHDLNKLGLGCAIIAWSISVLYFLVVCTILRSTTILANPFRNLNWWSLQFLCASLALSSLRLSLGVPGPLGIALVVIGGLLGAASLLLSNGIANRALYLTEVHHVEVGLDAPELGEPWNVLAWDGGPPWYVAWWERRIELWKQCMIQRPAVVGVYL